MVEHEPQIPHIPSEATPPGHSNEPASESAVKEFLRDNEIFFGITEELWEEMTAARQAFSNACAIPRRIVRDDSIDGQRVLGFQAAKSSNPADWPAGTRRLDPFPIVEGYADRAHRRVNSIDDTLRDFAPATFNQAEVRALIDLWLEDSPREEPPGFVQIGGDIDLYQDAHYNLGIAYDAAAIIQRVGVHKIDILLEDPERVVPFFTQVGSIAMTYQSGEMIYAGLLETIAADIGQARVLGKKSLLQSAIQRVLQSQNATGNVPETSSQAVTDSRQAILALRKRVRQLLLPLEHADRILQPVRASYEEK